MICAAVIADPGRACIGRLFLFESFQFRAQLFYDLGQIVFRWRRRRFCPGLPAFAAPLVVRAIHPAALFVIAFPKFFGLSLLLVLELFGQPCHGHS